MNENTPLNELQDRWNRCRSAMKQIDPEAEGLLVFSRVNLYYFTGTLANGVLYIPPEDEPVLFCRKGEERARIESPLSRISSFTSYRDIHNQITELGLEIPKTVAAEMNGLSWSLSNSLRKHWAGHEFIACDPAIAMTRAQKTDWELAIMREAGARHAKALIDRLPQVLKEGMSELEISHRLSEICFDEGYQGMLRMGNFGEEAYLGHIAIGDSANYPSVFNGPVGLRGVHPATPCMGHASVHWKPGVPLIVDSGFVLGGYQTDKTQVYWLGGKSTIPANARDAHAFCVDIQNWLADELRPGAIPSELWKQCVEKAGQSPWKEGFMGLGKNKVNFAGHGIGLTIDEYPVIADKFDHPLESGMVLAIEPKIGIPDFGMVGIENTFEITDGGGKSLTGERLDIITI